MKKKYIVAAVLCVVGLLLCATSLIMVGGNVFNYQTSAEYAEETLTVDEDFEDIDISGIIGKLVVETKDVENVQIQSYKRNGLSEYECTVNGSTLRIKRVFRIEFFVLNFGFDEPEVHVILPNKKYDDVKIKSNSGLAEVKNITANSFSIDNTSGESIVSNLTADSIYAHQSSGRTELNGVNVGKKIEIRVSSGHANAEIYGKEEDFSLEVKKSSGMLNVPTHGYKGPKSLVINQSSGSTSVKFSE